MFLLHHIHIIFVIVKIRFMRFHRFMQIKDTIITINAVNILLDNGTNVEKIDWSKLSSKDLNRYIIQTVAG